MPPDPIRAAVQKIVFRDHFRVGHPAIDAEHMRLFEIGNELLAAADTAAACAVATQLARAMRAHFAHEERLMQELGYCELRRHQALHAALLKRFDALSDRLARGDIDSFAVRSFLTGGLLGHTREEDKRLAATISARALFPPVCA